MRSTRIVAGRVALALSTRAPAAAHPAIALAGDLRVTGMRARPRSGLDFARRWTADGTTTRRLVFEK